METINLIQGSDEWLKVRKDYFCASEAPAMIGESKYISRTQLLDHKKGWTTEVDEFTKRLFEQGHEAERKALPLVESLVDEELYPLVGIKEGTKFLASFDGITMLEDVIFEHKLFNKTLAENILNDVVEPHYYWQLEHQLLVSGAEKVIFVTSDGTEENMKHMFYESVPERREALIKGWEQFEKDLETHEVQAKTESVTAIKPTELPVIKYEMNGLALTSNLDVFKAAADSLVKKSQQLLETDQDFADAAARQKIFDKAEKRLKELQVEVLSEAADISAFTEDLKYIGEQIRQARLAESKQIKERKEAIKKGILDKANNEVALHRQTLSKAIRTELPIFSISILDEMKGKKTVDSLQNAANTAVANIKIEANNYADIARNNMKTMDESADSYEFLFGDWPQIAFKANDDFKALVELRVSKHKAAEQARIEQEAKRLQEQKEREERERQAEIARQEERDRQAELERQQEEAKRLSAKKDAEEKAKLEAESAQAEEPQASASYMSKPQVVERVDKDVTPIAQKSPLTSEIQDFVDWVVDNYGATKPDFVNGLEKVATEYCASGFKGVA